MKIEVDLFDYGRFFPVEWVIFDADNTLWDLEDLYNRAKRDLCSFKAFRGFDPEDVADYQQRRDLELFEKYGRTPRRFPQSFVDTLLHFHPAPKLEEVEYVWKMGTAVFQKRANPYPGVAQALEFLSRRAYIAILTGGQKDVQHNRLTNFPYLKFVDEWEIVPRKDPASFRRFLDVKKINPRQSWMIGDSLRSDIIPAR